MDYKVRNIRRTEIAKAEAEKNQHVGASLNGKSGSRSVQKNYRYYAPQEKKTGENRTAQQSNTGKMEAAVPSGVVGPLLAREIVESQQQNLKRSTDYEAKARFLKRQRGLK